MQAEIGDRQREMFLREQMKAIQDELGEGEGGAELEELRAKLDALELPEDVRKEVDREFGRLARMGREAMESQVIRTYLETIAELPWNTRTEEQIDLKHAAKVLEEDHYGLEDVKDRVLEFLAVRQLQLQRDAAEQATTRQRRRQRRQEQRQRRQRPLTAPAEEHDRERRQGTKPTARRERAAARSCSSSALPASARRRSRSRSRARPGASTSASRSAASATRPTSAAIAAPTSPRCPAASSRA